MLLVRDPNYEGQKLLNLESAIDFELIDGDLYLTFGHMPNDYICFTGPDAQTLWQWFSAKADATEELLALARPKDAGESVTP